MVSVFLLVFPYLTASSQAGKVPVEATPQRGLKLAPGRKARSDGHRFRTYVHTYMLACIYIYNIYIYNIYIYIYI